MDKHHKFLILIGALVCTQLSFQPLIAQIAKVKFEQIDSLQKIAPRNVIVFIHTDWCKYCHAMQHITLKDKKVIEILNEHFYFVQLNAEDKNPITFRGHTFQYKPTGANTGLHGLAEQLATIERKVSFPTTCVLNESMEIVFQQPGYMSVKELQAIHNQFK